MPNLHRSCLFIILILIVSAGAAQVPAVDTLGHKTVIAQPGYQKKTSFYQSLWGHNRRKEWGTPVQVPVLGLDSAYGGLKPYEAGGGNETKSLRLQTPAGKEYSLRSINKSRDDVVDPAFKKTFIEDIIKDAVASSYPYGAFPVSVMQERAGINHTLPVLVYVPQQPALDTFNARYGNDLYLLEQRPDGNWSDADNLGNFKDFSSTDKVIKKLQDDNKYRADQYLFVKTRLFDMLIGDWDRHEDNWRWGKTGKGDETIFVPVPRDRDQAFYTHDGFLLDFLLPVGGFSYMQNFGPHMGNVISLNKEERYMDRFFSNEMSLDDWVRAAKELQEELTDTVIKISVQGLPPEIFTVSGNELIEKLRSRRGQLVEFATTYYLFIAKEVEIIGTGEKEYFEVNETNAGEITVSVYRIKKSGQKENKAYYKRIFKPAETKEVRLFGIDNEDVYKTGNSSTAITVRIIGGPAKDSVIQTGSRIHVYDDRNNVFQTSAAKLHLSSDSAIHTYKYNNYEYDSKGFGPVVSYDHQDRVYVGLSYQFKKHRWRREPYATKQNIGVKYSITQHAVSTFYTAIYPNLINHWDLLLNAKYDAAGWVNFTGLGNETIWDAKTRDYYQMRGSEWVGSAGLHRSFGKSTVELSIFLQHLKITNDTDRYAAKFFAPTHPQLYDPHYCTGLRLNYTYASVNNEIVPTKGIALLVNSMLANDLTQKEFFETFTAKLQAWLPLSKKFSLLVRTGGTTVAGDPKVINSGRYYQHAMIGGPETFRGYRMERFWGKTSFYNNNEFRFITNMRTYLMNAKIGLIAFFDDGRVWTPAENSNVWHTSYGTGLLLAPFNFVSFSLTYGISGESKMVQFRINTLF